MKKNVLILGGSYFVGRKIAAVLNENGYGVSVLNRGTKPFFSADIEQIVCDRNNAGDLKKALRGRQFDGIIDVSWQDIEWVKTICQAADFEHTEKFVFISSSSVYDVEHLHIPFRETDPLSENKYWTAYGKGKIEAEKYYRDFFENKATQLIILRPPYIYGEFNYAQRESFLFDRIREGKPIVLPKSNPKLQFIYSGDLAECIGFLLKREGSETAIYNVGNREAVSSQEWISLCSKIAGKDAKIVECDYEALGRNVRDFFPFFDYDNVLDVSRIHALYPEETPFEEGLKKAYNWYLENRASIPFKENVERNIDDIVLELSK